jgi:hypothetical protein
LEDEKVKGDDEKGKGNQSFEGLQNSGSRDFSQKKNNKFDDGNDLLGSRE